MIELEAEDIATVASLVGRTIVAAQWYDASPGEDWTAHEECRLTFDDGTGVVFGSWGHSASGATVQAVCRPGDHQWVPNKPATLPDYCQICFVGRPS